MSSASPRFGIAPQSLALLRQLFAGQEGIERVWIFGSRAQGHERPESDIDLAVEAPGWDATAQARLTEALAQRGLLYRVDLVFLSEAMNPTFRSHIEQQRVTFWEPRRPAVLSTLGGISLKPFQERVLDKLNLYLDELVRQRQQTQAQMQVLKAMEGSEDTLAQLADYPRRAWDVLRKNGQLPAPGRNPPKGYTDQHQSRWCGAGQAIPNVCLKVPTGGGKTLLAAAAVAQLMQRWLRRSAGLVLWVVPNEAIYRQTLQALGNRDHPYRQMLNVAAAGRVKVLEKSAPLTRQDVSSHLCVMVLMLAAANRKNKETLKFFADSGRVSGFLPPEDDLPAHHALLQDVPNLEAYRSLKQTAAEARAQMGSVVKASLGNVMRLHRPLVVIDEGHHAYSDGALQTIDGFNPSFMLELSATPRVAVVKKGAASSGSSGSNVLVNVRGTDLDEAEMIKLPIQVDVRGWSDWRACLGAALHQLNALQLEAGSLQANTARYIRPILLVQVERTGADMRDSGFIHADDAKEHLLRLGLQERHIAIKTSERNDLSAPENIDLLSPRCEVRVIITKQALQEGWDCPFAYVLCALAAGRNLSAMTQLVGRILRLPHVAKTGSVALDSCYVFCHDARTGEVVGAIKKSLEGVGMGDLGVVVRGADAGDTGSPDATRPVAQRRRREWQGVRLFLPKVTWVNGEGSRRDLAYESDVLAHLPWEQINPSGWVAQWAPDVQGRGAMHLSLGLELLAGHSPSVPSAALEEQMQSLDVAQVVRHLTDLAPNPWLAWGWVQQALQELLRRGLAQRAIAGSVLSLIEALRHGIQAERDRLAEAVFADHLAQGRIEFALRADQADYELPAEFDLPITGQAQAWMREGDAQPLQHTLYEPALRTPDINEFEHRVAGWLDEQQAVRWWHRNVARTQLGLQGWKRGKVYPDFVFAMQAVDGSSRVVLLETKGLHLDNDDTGYKTRLLKKLSAAFRDERFRKVGTLGLQGGSLEVVQCDLVFDKAAWAGQLNQRHFNPAPS